MTKARPPRWLRAAFTGLVALATVAAACSDSGPDGDGAAASTATAVLPSTTKVLDAASLDAIDSVEADSITLSSTTDTLAALEVGDVVVAGVSEHTPGGLLRKVTAIDRRARGATLTTADAAIEEAVESASVDHEQDLDLSAVDLEHPDTSFAEGVELVAGTGMGDDEHDLDEGALTLRGDTGVGPVVLASQPISSSRQATGNVLALDDVVLHDGENGRVTASGSIAFSPSFRIKLEVSDFQVDELTVNLGFEEGVTLALDATGSASLDENITVASVVLAVITIPAGPLPIVITPRVDFVVTATGSVSAELHASVVQTASATAGFGWRDGGFDAFGDSDSDFELDRPRFGGTATGRVALGGRVALCLWVKFCAYVQADGFVGLDAAAGSTEQCLDWTLVGGLDVVVGVDLPLVVVHVQEEAPVIEAESELDRFRCGPGGTDEDEASGPGRTPFAHTFGGDGGATAYAVESTRDGGSIVAGDASFASSFGGGTALWVVKLDPDGAIDWQHQYGGAGSARGVREVNDGYLVAASNGEVLKVNPSGRLTWARRYTVPDASGARVGVRVQGLSVIRGGGAVVAGTITTAGTGDDAVAFEIDPDGGVEWAHRFGGPGVDTAAGLARSADGSVLLAVATSGSFSSKESAWLLGLHPDGTVEWQRNYAVDWVLTPEGPEPTTVNAAAPTADGSFVVGGRVAGYSYNPFCYAKQIESGACTFIEDRGDSAAWVMRVDPGGDIRWSTALLMGTLDDRITSLAEVGSSIVGAGSLGVGAEQDVWGVQLRGDNGRLGWSRLFGGPRYDAAGPGLILRGGGQFVAPGGAGVRVVATSGSFSAHNQAWLLNLSRTGQVVFPDGSGATARNRGGDVVPLGEPVGPDGDITTVTWARPTSISPSLTGVTGEDLTDQIEVVRTR